ncbi:MAG TPA: thioredoxin domain-containing protein [Phycisphaerales bacterium]|jgi:thioredoxin 1|nr:thioredoxin domain-containing protein [Phycisphaerales bacterium]
MNHTDSGTLHPTAATFKREVLESSLPVIVDFWAPWCPPCMMLKPEMQRLALELAGKAKVAFISVDEEPDLAGMFRISSIPTVMIFMKGKRVDGWTGAASRAAIVARLQKHLANG